MRHLDIEVLRATLLAAAAAEEWDIDAEVLGTAGYKLADLLAESGGVEALHSEADSGLAGAAAWLTSLIVQKLHKMYSFIVAESMPERARVPSLPFTEARAHFTEIVGRAEYAKAPTIITKRGREVAVVMPIEALTYLPASLPEDTGRRSVAESVARLAALGEGTGLTHEQVVAALRAVREDAE